MFSCELIVSSEKIVRENNCKQILNGQKVETQNPARSLIKKIIYFKPGSNLTWSSLFVHLVTSSVCTCKLSITTHAHIKRRASRKKPRPNVSRKPTTIFFIMRTILYKSTLCWKRFLSIPGLNIHHYAKKKKPQKREQERKKEKKVQTKHIGIQCITYKPKFISPSYRQLKVHKSRYFKLTWTYTM